MADLAKQISHFPGLPNRQGWPLFAAGHAIDIADVRRQSTFSQGLSQSIGHFRRSPFAGLAKGYDRHAHVSDASAPYMISAGLSVGESVR